MVTAGQPAPSRQNAPSHGSAPSSPSAAPAGRTRLRDVALMLTAAGSTQTGAALGAHAFPAIGPAGVVAVRQLVAAAVLLPLGRPRVRSLRWAQWWPTLLLAAVFAAMNLAVCTTVDRIGLALAITLEFLGPLGVALLASRTRRDLITAIATGIGVYVLVLPGPTSDLLGVGIGLFSAVCWAGYILLNRLVGARLPGLQATALATTISAAGYLPVLAVLAVAAGMAILGQLLAWHEWVGIAVIVVANVVTVVSRRDR